MLGFELDIFKQALVDAGRSLPTVFITALEPEDVSGPLAALGRAGAYSGPHPTDGAKT